MLLEVENLHIAFRQDGRRSEPVRGVTFSIGEGEAVALVGESGSGKSLTALALGGLVNGAEISGMIRGKPRIAYIFQNPMEALNPVIKVGRQIAEAAVKGDEVVAELLEGVGLPAGTAEKYPCQLSGGQCQRVMIAMALAREPELLIADEPTTALDVTTQREVLDLIAEVASAAEKIPPPLPKMALLLITHNLALAAKYSQRVNVMYAGRIVESGETAAVLSSPHHPYTKGLIAAVPRLEAPKGTPLADIPGTVPPAWAWPTGCAFHPRCPVARTECSASSFTVCPETGAPC